MWNNSKRKSSVFAINKTQIFLSLLAVCLLSSCASDRRTVDPYRDRSYTRSVAKVSPNQTSPASPVQKKPMQKNNDSRLSARQPSSNKSFSAKSLLPMLTQVNDRIIAFEVKIEQWDKLAAEAATVSMDPLDREKIVSCQDEVNAILSRYEDVHQLLIRESNADEFDTSVIDRFSSTQRLDIGFLEGDCQQIVAANKQSDVWVEVTKEKLLEQREAELAEKMNSGEYLQVVDLYSRLPLEEGQYPSYDTTHNYGQALLRTGRENDAAEVYQNLLIRLREQNQLEQEFKLMKLIADIQFSLENFDKAFERYIHIINRYAGLGENIDWARRQQSVISVRKSQGIEVRNYAELLRSWLTYNPERDAFNVFLLAQEFQERFPESSVIPTVNQISSESRDRAEAWFALTLQRLNTLKGERKYEDALKYIDNLPLHLMPMDKREQLTMVSDELTESSFEEQESRRQALEEELQDIWSKGLNLLRTKDYDMAIEVFTSLSGTTYDERANDKVVEASQLAAQEDRREAAELFVRASNNQDRNTQVALLLQSRKLLQGIVVKYPQSGLVEKAKRNLERIEDEIRSIDPALLIEPDDPAGEQGMVQHSQITTVNGIPSGEWKEQSQNGFTQE